MFECMKHALIIGGSGGIGRAVATAYAGAGYAVGITYFENNEQAENTKAEIDGNGGTAGCFQVDITKEDSVKALFEKLSALDTLIIAAATEIPKSVEDASYDDWRFVTGVMIDGPFLCTKYALPLLTKSDNPNIVFFASMDGIRPNGEYLAYQVSEAANIAMMKANAKYLGSKYKIRVNAICPGPVRTGLWDKAGDNTDETWESFAKSNPLGRVGTPEDVARACLSLTEDEGKFLNGNTLFVDGGSGL